MPKIKIHPLFLGLIGVMLITGKFILFINFILAVIFHELAHLRVAEFRGYSLSKIELLPYGAVLKIDEKMPEKDQTAIFLAGPLLNFFFAVTFICLWWLIPDLHHFTYNFVLANLVIGVFNILPIYPLDGSRILLGLVNNRKPWLNAVKIMGIIFASVLLFLFVMSIFYKLNFTLGIMGAFLLVGALSGDKKEKYKHITANIPYVKNIKNGIKADKIIIREDMPLVKILQYIKSNNYNTFVIVDKKMNEIAIIKENEMTEIFEKYPLNEKIGKTINGKMS